MLELLHYLLENILPEGAKFEITEEAEDRDVTFTINIPEEFRGMLIGKGGNNINSIRRILNIRAKRDGVFAHIKVAD